MEHKLVTHLVNLAYIKNNKDTMKNVVVTNSKNSTVGPCQKYYNDHGAPT